MNACASVVSRVPPRVHTGHDALAQANRAFSGQFIIVRVQCEPCGTPENKETPRNSRRAARRGATRRSSSGEGSRSRGTAERRRLRQRVSLISRLSMRTEYSLERFFGIPDVDTRPLHRDFPLAVPRLQLKLYDLRRDVK